MTTTRFAIATLLVLSAACDRRTRVNAPDSVVAAPPSAIAQRELYLSVSDLNPASGDTVVVAATVQIGDSLSVSSFRARLAYDATGLTYLDEVVLPGMIRAVNPEPGAVTVAGASADVSPDGRLFAVRFRVTRIDAVRSLSLQVDELNDRNHVSQMASLIRSSRMIVDRSLVPPGAAKR